jgi:hypothetical protein
VRLGLRVVGGFFTVRRVFRRRALVSSTGVEHVVNRVVYCATGTEIYISAG